MTVIINQPEVNTLLRQLVAATGEIEARPAEKRRR
jgi:hypothetical protein